MNRWLTHLSAGALAMVICFTIASYFIGCSEDTTTSTTPEINFKDQYFSFAIGNGSDIEHSGSNLVLVDWLNDDNYTPKLVPQHTFQLPSIDGVGDDACWGEAQALNLTLSYIPEGVEPPLSSVPFPDNHDPITQVTIKSVYNYIGDKIAFLVTWSDDTQDVKKDGAEKIGTQSTEWEIRLDWDQDWFCFMWSIWQWHTDSEGDIDGLAELHTDFQTQGCQTTCHESARPYHLNSTMDDPFNPGNTISEKCDIWFWGSNYTNYAGEAEQEGQPQPPACMVDGFIDDYSGIIGDYNDPDAHDDSTPPRYYAYDPAFFTFQNDMGTPGYQHNTIAVGPAYYPQYMHIDQAENFTIYYPYLWLSEQTVTDEGVRTGDWEIGGVVTGYINRSGLGAASQVNGLGTYDNGTWTVEFSRDLSTGDPDDTMLDIYEPHDY